MKYSWLKLKIKIILIISLFNIILKIKNRFRLIKLMNNNIRYNILIIRYMN